MCEDIFTIMLVELTSNKETQLNKWFKVREVNGNPVKEVYVRFARAWDRDGNSLYIVPKTETTIYVDLVYNGENYP